MSLYICGRKPGALPACRLAMRRTSVDRDDSPATRSEQGYGSFSQIQISAITASLARGTRRDSAGLCSDRALPSRRIREAAAAY